MNDKRSGTSRPFNINPHWTCKCGMKNQKARVICLNCGEDSDYH